MLRQRRIAWVVGLLQLLVVADGVGASTGSPEFSGAVRERGFTAGDEPTEESVAAERYVANLKALISRSIVPGIRRGVLAISVARPPALFVEVTADPSPYHVGSSTDSNGALHVRLSLGYVTMHDAALDAVALSAALDRPGDLRSYLTYQLVLARANEHRQAIGQPRRRAMDFARFARLDPKTTQALLSRGSIRREREKAEMNSLGWVVAYLLVKLDSRLAGDSAAGLIRDGRGAANLAAASGWFPAPPLATALGLAEVVPSTSAPAGKQSSLCRAANLMEAGVDSLKASEPWRSRLEGEPALQRGVAAIQSDVTQMRHDGDCVMGIAASL